MNQSASKLYTREFLTAMAAYVVVLPISITLMIALWGIGAAVAMRRYQ